MGQGSAVGQGNPRMYHPNAAPHHPPAHCPLIPRATSGSLLCALLAAGGRTRRSARTRAKCRRGALPPCSPHGRARSRGPDRHAHINAVIASTEMARLRTVVLKFGGSSVGSAEVRSQTRGPARSDSCLAVRTTSTALRASPLVSLLEPQCLPPAGIPTRGWHSGSEQGGGQQVRTIFGAPERCDRTRQARGTQNAGVPPSTRAGHTATVSHGTVI